MNINELIQSEELQVKKLAELVQNAIEEEQLLSEKLISAEKDQNLTLSQSLADKIAAFGGSWTFIITFLFCMAMWIVINIFFLKDKSFDPYPFILLNLILSCVAALQAPVIMMSQNRQEEKDRRRARNDYMINLKAEIEVRNLHSKIDLLMADQMKALFETQRTEIKILEELQMRLSRIELQEKK